MWGSGYSGVGSLVSVWSWYLYRPLQHNSVYQFRTAVLSTGCFHCCLQWLLTYDVGSWWELSFSVLLGLFAVLLTSFPSLCSCTAPQSTLPLLPSSSSWFLCSLFCILFLLQCLCTSVVSAAVSGHTDPDAPLWLKVESFSSISQGPLDLLRAARLLDCFKGCLRTQRAANFIYLTFAICRS